jgi:hypothetical protein
MLYYAMVHFHLLYCLNIYSSANITNLQRLRIKQKESLRIIFNVGYREHTRPLFKSLKILPLDEMITYANLKFMHIYSFVHKTLPLSFHDMWIFNRDRNMNRVLRNANNLFVPAHNFATLTRFPLFSFPRLWNDEEERKFTQSRILYCKMLKSALLANIVD